MGDSPAKNPFQYAQQFVKGKAEKQRADQLGQIATTGDVIAPDYLDPQHARAFKAFKRHGVRPEYDYPELPNAYRDDYSGAQVRAADDIVKRKAGVRFGGQLDKAFSDEVLQQGLALAQLDEASLRAQGKARDLRALPPELEEPEKAAEVLPDLYERLPDKVKRFVEPSVLDQQLIHRAKQFSDMQDSAEARRIAIESGQASPEDAEITLRFTGSDQDISSQYRGLAPSGEALDIAEGPGLVDGLATELFDPRGNEYFGGPKDQDKALVNLQTQTNLEGHKEIAEALRSAPPVSPFSGYTGEKYPVDRYILPLGQTSDGKVGVDILAIKQKVLANLLDRELERGNTRPTINTPRYAELVKETDDLIDKWAMQQRDVPLIDRRSRKDRARAIVRGEDWTGFLQANTALGLALWASEATGLTDAIGNVAGIDDLSGKVNTVYYGITAPVRAMFSSFDTFLPGQESLEQYRYGESVENIGQGPFSWFLDLGAFTPIASTLHNVTLSDNLYESFEKTVSGAVEDTIAGEGSMFSYMSDLDKPHTEWSSDDYFRAAMNTFMMPIPMAATYALQSGIDLAESGISAVAGKDIELGLYFADFVPFLGELPDLRLGQLANIIPAMGAALFEPDAISLLTFGTGKAIKVVKPALRASYLTRAIDTLEELKSPEAMAFLEGKNVDYLEDLRKTDPRLHKVVVQELATALEMRGQWAKTSRDGTSPITPSIPGHMRDLVEHLAEAEKAGGDLDTLILNVNQAVVDVKKALDAMSEEELAYKFLSDYVANLPDGQEILEESRKFQGTAIAEKDLSPEFRLARNAEGNPVPGKDGRRTVQADYDRLKAQERVSTGIAKDSLNDTDAANVAYNPDNLLSVQPADDGGIRVAHFDFDEQFDVASQGWADEYASAVVGSDQLVGRYEVTTQRVTQATTGSFEVPKRTAKNEGYQNLAAYVEKIYGGLDDAQKAPFRAAISSGGDVLADVIKTVMARLKEARKDGDLQGTKLRKNWIEYALRVTFDDASEVVGQTVDVSRKGQQLSDLLDGIKSGGLDNQLRSIWLAEVEQLRKAGFFEKATDPWDNLPMGTIRLRNALKRRAEILRSRFDADTTEVNRLSDLQQTENLAMALASARRRILMSKKQSLPVIKLALQKIAENGWDDFIGRGISKAVPKMAREALEALDGKDASKAWDIITKLLKDKKLDEFSAQSLKTADLMRAQAKTVRDFEDIWTETITRIQDDLTRGRDIVQRGDLPEEPALEVNWADTVLRSALARGDDGKFVITDDGKSVLDVVAYNKGIVEQYGITEAVNAFKTEEWKRVYEIRSAGATAEIDAVDRALLKSFEDFLQGEKRSIYIKKKGIRTTATLFGTLNDPTMPISMSFWKDPAALYTTIRAIVAKFKAKVDPSVARFGVVSRAVAAVGRSMRESSWRTMDEIAAIQRYALKNGLDPVELIKQYLTTTEPLRLGREDQFFAQRTVMNKGVPLWQKFTRIMREPPKRMVGQASEDAQKDLITSDTFLNSLARMWLRADDPAESSVKQIIRDLKVGIRRTGDDAEYTELFKRLGIDEPGDVMQDYDTFVKFTYDVAQYHKKLVREPYEDVLANVRVANTMAVIVGSGAVLDDMVTQMIRAVGPKMSVGQANDMMNIIKGDYFRVEDAGEAMDAFLRTGIPFSQNRRLIADTDGRKLMSLYTAARKEGVAIIPSRIYEEISRELAKFERQFDPLSRAEASTLRARGRMMWTRFMGELRQGMTTGLLFNAPHWVNTVWGDFWQMQETVGFGTAAKVTAANVLVTNYRVASGLGSMTMRTIPGIGPKLENYSVQLKKWVARKYGLDENDPAVLDRVLPTILETYVRADVIRAWDHRFNGTFDLGDGFSVSADELRRMMAEDGVFDFSLAQDQIELNQLIHLKNLERQYLDKLKRAQKKNRPANELETIRLELEDVQRARAESEGPIIGAAMRQVRRLPGQRKVGELLDFSRDVARESMQHFQQRQRAALYMDVLRKTKSRDKARQAVGRALYDWNHGLTPFEMQTFSRYFLFYRFTRLNLTEGLRKLMGPFTEYEQGLNLGQLLTGQTRLSRTQDQLQIMDQFRQEVMKAQGDPLASGQEMATQEQMRQSLLRHRPPGYFKFQHGFVVPLDPDVQRFWMREYGRKADVGFARLPEMSSVQQFEALSHTTSLIAMAAGLIPGQPLGRGKPGTETIRDTLEFVTDQMTPGIGRIMEAAINRLTGEDSFNGSRPLSPGQEVMYREALRAIGAEGYLTQVNEQGRLGVPDFLHLLLSNMPYVSSQGRRVAEAIGANPGREYDEWAANAFKIMVGLRPSVYSSTAEYDKRQKDIAAGLKEMAKGIERRPTKPRQLGYPYNLDD
jgi:hypothetical protein